MKFTVEFTKPTYQYITVEAESESQAIRRATALLSDNEWSDYGNHPDANIIERVKEP